MSQHNPLVKVTMIMFKLKKVISMTKFNKQSTPTSKKESNQRLFRRFRKAFNRKRLKRFITKRRSNKR
jgi:hypothetical protein